MMNNSDSLTEKLRLAVKDLTRVNPWVGLLRLMILVSLFLLFVILTWLTDNIWVFGINSAIAGFLYAFCLICTHDSTHNTLTGWSWFEAIAPRLLSYPMLWPYGVYSELHRLHHAWNGRDFRDPERIEWTKEEYTEVAPLLRWYVRHQWVIDIFVLGGVGLIVKTWVNGMRFQSVRPRLRWQLGIDVVGMIVIQGIFVFSAVYYGVIWRYLLFWFILERAIGIVTQTRDHLEHYRMWNQQPGYQLTQLYSCRNLKVNPLTQWLMGGLPYHSVHHCFPEIPFNRLPSAFERIQLILKEHNLPLMIQDSGYFRATWRLKSQPTVITSIQGGHQDL
ncbi:fatty acid desaturase [Gloeocapsa sp. PCC 73106]|uniref:fatty acid desaturase family protein n=1 Tax=Gloeocapsa sp. PCC 73106 TaxID=102232 RepID=UPI0002AB9BF6|nr:fatty acid desaturase [Gloeocapsa sp. PCC 73106]ELR98404.1 fatty acid desaturase [Gloeocapsa sp. PCC 73106]